MLEIKSNTMGKLRKIYQGKSFSDRLVVITEMYQNAQRAEAKEVHITIEGDTLSFADNGCGCDNPELVFTLDLSSWKSTDEGFGIGLFSFLNVEDVEQIEVYSKDWKSSINVKELFESGIPQATVVKTDGILDGFKVVIRSPYFAENADVVKHRCIIDGELQLYDVYINGDLIPKRDLQAEVSGDFVKKFENALFSATLGIHTWESPNIYYEKRFVSSLYLDGHYCKGVVEISKNSLTLQEPDRKNIIHDKRRDRFKNKLIECVKDLYTEFIKVADNKQVDKYANVIAKILDVRDYEKYILTDEMVEEFEKEQRNVGSLLAQKNSLEALFKDLKKKGNNSQVSLFEQSQTEEEKKRITRILNLNNEDSNVKWVSTGEIDENDHDSTVIENPSDEFLKTVNRLVIGGIVYKKVNVEEFGQNFEQEDEESVWDIDVQTVTVKKGNLKEAIKKASRKVWVKASESEEYKDLRAKAEYYGVKVFVANNVLHEKVFEKYEVPYITEIKEGVQKRYFQKNVCLKTKKEENFIELLYPICDYYNLPRNTFFIGDIKLYIETKLQGKVINREIMENKKGEIRLGGVCQEGQIILDRRALDLSRFNLTGNGIGINEIKAIFANVEIIAHELAHLLYNTEDNTEKHFKKEREIQREITNLYLTL
jgi:predicted house-cleaning noncanonical NTP pyrophosphatase (MazG superfamily)